MPLVAHAADNGFASDHVLLTGAIYHFTMRQRVGVS